MFEYMQFNIAPWGSELVLYFFLVGMAAMAFVLAAAPATVGGSSEGLESTQKIGSLVVIVLMGICGVLLIEDLGQPSRFLYPILHFHYSSPLAWGSLFVLGFSACAVLFAFAAFTGNTGLMKPVGLVGSVLALLLPLYTGWDLMAQQSRELWHSASIPAMFVALSVSSGVALMSVIAMVTGGLQEQSAGFLRKVLLVAVTASLVLFIMDYLRMSYGSAEELQALAFISENMSGSYWTMSFLVGMVAPLVLLLIPSLATNPVVLTAAGVLGAVGAYTYRDVIMTAGQIPQLFF